MCRWWAGAAPSLIRSGYGVPARPIPCASMSSMPAITSPRKPSRFEPSSISKVLYPSNSTPAGQELRLRQEYFFASASLQDLIHRHLKQHGDITKLAEHVAIQLNDTHPAIAVPELMRLLVDVYGVGWEHAWSITQATFSYTNHTLLPEALEIVAGAAHGACASAPHADHLSHQRPAPGCAAGERA